MQGDQNIDIVDLKSMLAKMIETTNKNNDAIKTSIDDLTNKIEKNSIAIDDLTKDVKELTNNVK